MATRQFEILLNGVHDSSGEPLGSGKVYTYIAGTTTLATTYVDKDSLTPASNPVLLDSNGAAQIYGDGAYKLIIKDVNDVTLYTYDNVFIGVVDSQLVNSGSSTGSANAYILTNDVPSTAYAVLDTYRFIANFANTGVATVNIDGLGVKNIKRFDGTNLSSGDIAINSFNEIVYNGTDFLLATNGTALSGSIAGLQTTLTTAIQNSSYVWGGTSGGSANAQTLTLTPTLTAYANGQTFSFQAGFTNTGNCTLNINGLGAKTIANDNTLSSLNGGEILVNHTYFVRYDGSNFRLLHSSKSVNQAFYLQGSTVVSTTSTSMILLPGMTQSVTVKAGDLVMIKGDASMSHNTIYGQGKLSIYKAGSLVTPEMTVREHDDASTAGRSFAQSVNFCEKIVTGGTFTYELRWETNTGTVYCEQRCMSIIVVPNDQ